MKETLSLVHPLCRSLDNMSNQIRWSLDLRWQRPDLPNGFYGLKDCITMAKSSDPGFKVDWRGWAEQDRSPLQKGAVSADKATEVDEAAKKAEGVHGVLGALKMNFPADCCCHAAWVHRARCTEVLTTVPP